MSRKDVVLFGITAVVIVGAILLQYSQNEVPAFLTTAVASVLAYWFGGLSFKDINGDE